MPPLGQVQSIDRITLSRKNRDQIPLGDQSNSIFLCQGSLVHSKEIP